MDVHVSCQTDDILVVDIKAKELIPSDCPDNYVPCQTGADGNCFPRAISRAVTGSEIQHMEYRVRIAAELALHEELYVDEIFLRKGFTEPLKDREKLVEFYTTCHQNYLGETMTAANIKKLFR